MKPRRFSLQAVLELRDHAREAAEKAHAAAIKDRDAAAARVAEAARRLDELTAMITGDRFPAYVREQGWTALTAQRNLLHTLQARLAEEEKKVADRLNTLIIADRDHRLVLKIKDKWTSRCNADALRHEEKQLEDFVTANRFLQSAH